MNARKLVLAILVFVFVPVCVFAAGAPAAGAVTQIGSGGHAGGQLWEPSSLAVDGSGDLYVDDGGIYLGNGNYRVDKFDASGSFLLAWGEGVAGGTAQRETCITFCQPGSNLSGFPSGPLAVDDDPLSASYGDVYVMAGGVTEKFGPSGEFLTSLPFSGGAIAVGPGGLIYVGGVAQVQVFEQSGTLKETISLSGLSSTATVSTLTVDSTGDVFLRDGEVPGMHEFQPGGVERSVQFDAGSSSIDGFALDGSGHLFVSDFSGGFHVLEYDVGTGEEIASFAHNVVTGDNFGFAFSQATGELYADEFVRGEYGAILQATVKMFSPPSRGPLVEGEVATPEQAGAATVEAVIDPEGAETTYSVEYVAEAQFQASGFAGAASTAPVSIPADFEQHGVVAHLTGLTLGAMYRWRVVAHNANGTTAGVDSTFEETPAALVSGPWTSDIASTSATLSAQIDPLGASTEYRFEYGTSLSYGQVLSGSVGEGTTSVPVSRHLQELSPGTVYHYRIVTHSSVGTFESVDHTFTTQPAMGEGESMLPDGRAWELVSPPNKGGAVIGPFSGGDNLIQAASDGSAITYVAKGVVGEGAVGRRVYSQTLSSRGAGGWASRALSIPEHIPTEERKAGVLFYTRNEFVSFSPDLSLGVVEPPFEATTPLSPEATGRTLYVRNNVTGSFVPLVYPGDIPPGTKFYGPHETLEERMRFVGATRDASHVLFSTSFALTPEASGEGVAGFEGGGNIYEWSAGGLQLVNIFPDGQPTGGWAMLGASEAFAGGAPAVSSDGRWVVWHREAPRGYPPSRSLYVRDMVERKTVRMGSAYAYFEGISSDGSRVFFEDAGNLYVFYTGSDTSVDLTASREAGETSAGLGAVRVSEDGSYVYFVATGVLASGGVRGSNNVYVSHDQGGVWSTGYVGTLSSEDQPFGFSSMSPDGRFLAFMSNRSLTGYDNLDASSGRPDQEVFLYDAVANRLVCASCDPTGARPIGVLDTILPSSLFDTDQAWHGVWVAGSLPDTDDILNHILTSSQPRAVSDSGRLFFNSSDALARQDTNGLMDVYEYEPAGVGGCVSREGTFSERSDGCVGLISSGTSSGESVFLDASASGNDAFFATSGRLTAADYDTSYDVYDAHVCSASVPCVPVPVSPPECTTADSCKAALSPQPEIFGPAPSATFAGIGKVVEEAKKPTVKRKVKPKHKKRKRKGRKAKRSRAGRARGSSAGAASVNGGRRSS